MLQTSRSSTFRKTDLPLQVYAQHLSSGPTMCSSHLQHVSPPHSPLCSGTPYSEHTRTAVCYDWHNTGPFLGAQWRHLVASTVQGLPLFPVQSRHQYQTFFDGCTMKLGHNNTRGGKPKKSLITICQYIRSYESRTNMHIKLFIHVY